MSTGHPRIIRDEILIGLHGNLDCGFDGRELLPKRATPRELTHHLWECKDEACVVLCGELLL